MNLFYNVRYYIHSVIINCEVITVFVASLNAYI